MKNNMISDERQVIQVLAKYTRAADYQDGDAMAGLFTPNGKVEVYYGNSLNKQFLFELTGTEEIRNAISNLMKPHPERGCSHHTTHDHIVEITEDNATIDAQFIRFDSVGAARPENGWPEGVIGLIGTVTPTEAGYYQPTLQKIDGEWKIITQRIFHDLPFAFPGN